MDYDGWQCVGCLGGEESAGRAGMPSAEFGAARTAKRRTLRLIPIGGGLAWHRLKNGSQTRPSILSRTGRHWVKQNQRKEEEGGS